MTGCDIWSNIFTYITYQLFYQTLEVHMRNRFFYNFQNNNK